MNAPENREGAGPHELRIYDLEDKVRRLENVLSNVLVRLNKAEKALRELDGPKVVRAIGTPLQ